MVKSPYERNILERNIKQPRNKQTLTKKTNPVYYHVDSLIKGAVNLRNQKYILVYSFGPYIEKIRPLTYAVIL